MHPASDRATAASAKMPTCLTTNVSKDVPLTGFARPAPSHPHLSVAILMAAFTCARTPTERGYIERYLFCFRPSSGDTEKGFLTNQTRESTTITIQSENPAPGQIAHHASATCLSQARYMVKSQQSYNNKRTSRRYFHFPHTANTTLCVEHNPFRRRPGKPKLD